MYHFYLQWERDVKGGTSACHYESMTEQTNTFRSTNKSHGKLTGVNLVFHQQWAVSTRIKFPRLFCLSVLFSVTKTIYIFFA